MWTVTGLILPCIFNILPKYVKRPRSHLPVHIGWTKANMERSAQQPPVDVDRTPLGGWEEFFPDIRSSAPSGGNVGVYNGGGTGRPLDPNVPLQDVWYGGNPPPPPPLPLTHPAPATSSTGTRSSSVPESNTAGVFQSPGAVSQAILSAEGFSPVRLAPGTQPSVDSSSTGRRPSHSGPNSPHSPAVSGQGAYNSSQLSPGYLQALAAVGVFPPLDASSAKSGSKRPRNPDDHPAGADSTQSSSPDLEALRRKLRALQATSDGGASPARFPVGERISDAGSHGEDLPSRPAAKTPNAFPVDMLGVSQRSSSSGATPSDVPFFSPEAILNRSPLGPSPAKQQTPPRRLRRVPRRRNLRPPRSSAASNGSPPQRRPAALQQQAPAGPSGGAANSWVPGRDVVTEQIHDLYWPPDRQRLRPRRGMFRRVIDGTRRLGRSILTNRSQRRDRQRAALRLGVSREGAAAAADDINAGAGFGSDSDIDDDTRRRLPPRITPDGYAGIVRSPTRGREVFYVPPPGYVVRGFQRVGECSDAVGEGRRAYFYSPSSVAGQLILEEAGLSVVPSSSELVDVVDG